MIRGFRSLDQALGWSAEAGQIGDFVDVRYGVKTSWSLLAEFWMPSGARWIRADNPVSYRVHDERELVSYWVRRNEEGLSYAFSYEIEQSTYLDEIRGGVSALVRTPLRHFLMGGQNTCIEVIATEIPLVLSHPPEMKPEGG